MDTVFSLPRCCISTYLLSNTFYTKMTITDIKKLTENEAKRRLNGLIDLDYYLGVCKTYGLPHLLHRGDTSKRNNVTFGKSIDSVEVRAVPFDIKAVTRSHVQFCLGFVTIYITPDMRLISTMRDLSIILGLLMVSMSGTPYRSTCSLPRIPYGSTCSL